MANPEHLAKLKEGVEAWNAWRIRDQVGSVDLGGAELQGLILEGINLKSARLLHADFRGADLGKAELVTSQLRGAYLDDATFSGANLRRADLSDARGHGAVFIGANLQDAILDGVHFQGAFLVRADLRSAKVRRAHFRGATFRHANLLGADLSEAVLEDADLSKVQLDAGANTAATLSGATIDWITAASSLHLDCLQFLLERTGMPRIAAVYLIDSLKSIDATDLFTMLQSVFLSYGRPDQTFAERLRSDLQGNGVKTWYFPKDAIPGKRIHRHIEAELQRFDRMILCCSKASLIRPGVLHEVETIIEREREEKMSEVLIPVLIDDIFDSGRSAPDWWPEDMEDLYDAIRRRVSANFVGLMDPGGEIQDRNRWNEEIGKLLLALRKRPEERQ